MTERVEALIGRPGDAVIGIIGGTGEQGRGLALRWARSGSRVLVGSREESRAQAVASSLGRGVTGVSNDEAARSADVVVLAVPWEAHASTLRDLQGSLVGGLLIDCVNPLDFDKQGPVARTVEEGSAMQQAASLLPDVTVVGAFHHVSAALLLDETVESIDCDVMVVGDDLSAVELTIALANRVPGLRGYYAGRLRNGGQVEALTANLIAINRRYRTRAGVRITGV